MMQKPELTDEEKAIYNRIVILEKIDDMFEFGYAIGRERLAKESLELFNNQNKENK